MSDIGELIRANPSLGYLDEKAFRTRQVFLVTGPPCAGKSTYVRQQAKPGDLVLDQDRIGQAEMARGIDRVAAMDEGRAWIIRCCPGVDNRAALAATLRADDVVVLRPDNDELFTRARRRPDPYPTIQAIRRWVRVEAGHAPTPPRTRDPRPRSVTRW